MSQSTLTLTIPTKQEVLSILRQNQAQIKRLGVKRLGLFGSFARDEQHLDSDIDLLVEFEPDQKTFDHFIHLSFLLEDCLQRSVELVTPESLSPYLRPYILKELNMSLSVAEYLRHILDETNYLIGQTQGLSQDEFGQDETLKRAFVRSVEIIREAAKKVPEEFRRKHPQIEWRAMAGMRDRLIHAYFGIDYDIVWDVVINKVPQLQRDIVAIMRQEKFE